MATENNDKEFKVKESDLQELLAEVEADLKSLLKSEEETLSKGLSGSSEPEKTKEEATTPEASEKPPGIDTASAAVAMDPKDGSAMPPADENPAAESAPEAPAPEAGPPDHGEGTPGEIEPAPTMEGLQSEYEQLEDDDLKMHYMAAKAALYARMGEPAQPAPEAEMAPAPAPAAAPAPDATMKKEMSAEKSKEASASKESSKEELSKSENDKEIDNLKKKIDEQDKAMVALAEAVDKVIAQPIRKSIKGISDLNFVPKTEDKDVNKKLLSKTEINAKLCERVRDPKLSKKDRELVNDYCVGNITFEKIEHLLKD